MELIIDREIWLRGETDSYLMRESDGKKCCLGIYLESCGVDSNSLKQITDAPALPVELPEQAGWLMDGNVNSDLGAHLMSANDDGQIRPIEREREIRHFFYQVGITLRFIN